jgi:hypothetical protein
MRINRRALKNLTAQMGMTADDIMQLKSEVQLAYLTAISTQL